jgi:hypothetical protein
MWESTAADKLRATFDDGRTRDGRLSGLLHREVCAGRMSLAEAQRQIATDRILVWRRVERQASVTGR